MKTITTVEVDKRGALTIGIDGGAQLFVGPHPKFESWELSGQGVASVLVGPGGETNWAALDTLTGSARSARGRDHELSLPY